MKKVLVAVALVMGLGSSVAFAQEVINTTSVEMQAQVPQDEFTKIDVKELPETVAQAVAKNYEGATIKEAYVEQILRKVTFFKEERIESVVQIILKIIQRTDFGEYSFGNLFVSAKNFFEAICPEFHACLQV